MSAAEDSNTTSVTSLSLVVNERALSDMNSQRLELNQFISKCLVKDVDFGLIPKTPKPSLYKPGAEKLAKLFKLGTKIVDRSRDLDMEKGWALFSYTIEVFHLPTGQLISQCEGSANSYEKKFESRPAADMLNTLQKMAQKRAYVGAVIIATGASDFFTQDVEDMDLGTDTKPVDNRHAPKVPSSLGDYIPKFGKYAASKQRLADIEEDDLRNYMNWIRAEQRKTGKAPNANTVEFMQAAQAYLSADDPLKGIPF